MRRVGKIKSLGLLGLATISLMAGTQLIFSPFAAAIGTKPSVSFYMNGSCRGGGVCGAHYTATANPSHYSVRAWERCSPATSVYLYGGWHSGTGHTSNTASCAAYNSFAIESGFQYDQTHTHTVQCWVASFPLSGNC